MTRLADWIDYGRDDPHNRNKSLVRLWLREARGHVPVIDRVRYPDERRLYPGISRRG